MTPDISHYPATKLMGKVVHELPEAGETSCRGCSFEVYNEETDNHTCLVTADATKDHQLSCGERPIVYVRPIKKYITAYITAKLSE